MPLSRRSTVSLYAGVALLVLATAIYSRPTSSKNSEPDVVSEVIEGRSASSAAAADVPIPVEGAAAVRGTLVRSISAPGQAAAWRRTVISAQLSGRIAALPIRESQQVGSGQTLVALDPAEYGLAVEEAETGLRDAHARLRELTVFDDRISDAEVRRERSRAARSRSGVDAAEIKVRRARVDLARTRLAAPFPGRVASLKVVPGQWVSLGDELLTVIDLDPIKVEVQVLESDVGTLSPGRPARVTFTAFPTEVFSGRVETINPVVESATQTARVTVLIPNPQGRILPGMYARVSVDGERFANRVLVPRSAVIERDRRPVLFVVEDGPSGEIAKWRYVTLGVKNDSVVEIVPNPNTDSVAPNEIVLTGGHLNLIHDARIRVLSEAEQQEQKPE